IILFGGNYLTSAKKEKMLINSAKSIIESNKTNSDKLLNYTFSKSYIKETTGILRVLSATDKNFPSVTLIVKDSIKGAPVFLGFNAYYNESLDANDSTQPQKVNYIYQTTKEERA